MSQHIKNLIDEGEHQQLDFKFEISDSKKIARTFSAFANTDGGRLLIGVKDNGIITGVRTDEEEYMVESAADIFCRPKIIYSIKRWSVDNKWILEVTILKRKKSPHYAKSEDGKWYAYVRVDDQNHLADTLQLKVWDAQRKNNGVLIRFGRTEKQILELIKLDYAKSISELLKFIQIKKKQLESILVRLIIVGILELRYTENGFILDISSEIEKKYELIEKNDMFY